MTKNLTLATLLLIIIGIPVLVFVVPGCVERRAFLRLVEEDAGIERFRRLLGEPTEIYRETEVFRGSQASKRFPHVSPKEGHSCFVWAQEGVPYYTIIVVVDDDSNEVIQAAIEN